MLIFSFEQSYYNKSQYMLSLSLNYGSHKVDLQQGQVSEKPVYIRGL